MRIPKVLPIILNNSSKWLSITHLLLMTINQSQVVLWVYDHQGHLIATYKGQYITLIEREWCFERLISVGGAFLGNFYSKNSICRYFDLFGVLQIMGQFDAKDRPFRNLDVSCQVLDGLGYLWLSLITIVTTKDAKEVRIDVELGV